MFLTISGTVKQDRESSEVYEFVGMREVTQEQLVEMARQSLVIAIAGNLRKVLDNPEKLAVVCKKQGVTVAPYVPTVPATKKVDISKMTVEQLEELLAQKVAEQASK